MANGKPFDMDAYTVAHRNLSLGTRVCLRNPKNNKEVFAMVTDRGPYVEPRIVDLSKRIASELEIGLGTVEIYVL